MSFDNYAKNWDTEKRIERAKVISKKIVDSININDSYSVMEFGCGTGLISFNMCDKFKSIALVDSSKGMIDILNSKIEKYKVTNMYPFHLDISNNSEIEEKYDVIYNSMVLHHIQDVEGIIKKFYSLLNEGGQLRIVDIDEEDGRFHGKYPDFDGHNGFNQEALKKILIDVGFKDVEINTFYYDDKIIKDEIVKYSLFLVEARKAI